MLRALNKIAGDIKGIARQITSDYGDKVPEFFIKEAQSKADGLYMVLSEAYRLENVDPEERAVLAMCLMDLDKIKEKLSGL